MTLHFQGEKFAHIFVTAPSPKLTYPQVFDTCAFDGCAVDSDLREPVLISGHRLRDSTVRGCRMTGVIIEDCVVDGLKVKNLPIIDGCLFRHVVIRGRVDKLLINANRVVVGEPTHVDEEKRLASEYYASVDWALDISEMDSPDFAARGIPSSLIRRDPATQAVITRQAARSTAWRDIDLSGTSFGVAIQDLARNDWEDTILVAPRTGRLAERAQEAIRTLQRLELAM